MKALRRFSGALHNEGKAFLKEHSWFYDNGIFKRPSYYEILEIKDFSFEHPSYIENRNVVHWIAT